MNMYSCSNKYKIEHIYYYNYNNKLKYNKGFIGVKIFLPTLKNEYKDYFVIDCC